MSERIFNFSDQQLFARLSGDYNPLHTDPIRSRRLMYGEIVVPGIHLLMWALNHWMSVSSASGRTTLLQAIFNRPVRLGEPVQVSIDSAENGQARLKVYGATGTCVNIRLRIDPLSAAPESYNAIKDSVPPVQEPRNLGAGDIASAGGEIQLYLPISEIKVQFPHIFKLLSVQQVAVLLATTRLVGMECPGERSLFSELVLDFNPPDSQAQKINYKVSAFDARFSIATIDLNGAVKGRVKAFLRPDPVEQASFGAVKNMVARGEFDCQRALVVGGSRGLGEVTAKILAAGGGNALVTYRQGIKEAEDVAHQINSIRNAVEAGGKAVAARPTSAPSRAGRIGSTASSGGVGSLAQAVP